MTTRTSSSHSVRRFASVGAALAVTALAAVASADEPKCPPDAWFCAEGEIKIGVPGNPPPPVTPAPAPPPVVVYTPAPAPPPPVVQPQPVYYPPPPPPPPRQVYRSEVGINFHLTGAAFGSNENMTNSAAAGGVGAAIRFRPTPRFALDLGLDVIGGTDANGFKRSEVPFTIAGLLYLNPRSKVQVYLLGGIGFSTARVETVTTQGYTVDDRYSYFGGLFGGGLELRIAPKVALNFDVRGFVRGRTDDAAKYNPEFRAKDGRTTNTSGGALFNGGLTLYF